VGPPGTAIDLLYGPIDEGRDLDAFDSTPVLIHDAPRRDEIVEAIPVYLLAIYPKNQQVDLTPQQKARLIALGTALKAEALRKARAGRVPRRG
jgi:hypothetical protein